jgi:hypothetical protein
MPSLSSIEHPARSVQGSARRLTVEHPAVVTVGKAGWFAKGVVYVIAGVLALSVAVKASGWSDSPDTGNQEASPTGAIKTVAGSGGGTLLLWLLAIGMLIYAGWRVLSAFMPGGSDADARLHRIGYIVSAIVYIMFAITAIALARRASTDANGNTQVTDITSSIMSNAAGRWLIGLVGVIVMAVGLYRLSKGIKVDVDDELDLSGMSATRVKCTRVLGAIGEFGRGIGIGLVGFFLLRAAITYHVNEATGLDGALRRLATNSWGVVVVFVVGIGFAAYGIFCLATFTHRRLEAP